MDDRDHIGGPAREEVRTQSAVLQYVLSLHPAQLSLDDLRREFASEAGDFSRADALQRAVRELVSAGLLQRSGQLVLPTRAALRLDELLGG